MDFNLDQSIRETGCPHADCLSWQVDTLDGLLRIRPKNMNNLLNIGPVRSRDIAEWRRNNGLNFTIVPGTPEKEEERTKVVKRLEEERTKVAKKLKAKASSLRCRHTRNKIRRMWCSGRSYSYIAGQLRMGFQEVHKIIDSAPASTVRRRSKLIPWHDAR